MTAISATTPRPSGMTGVYWLNTGWSECFAVIDATNASTGTYGKPAQGTFIADPALTGGDDCGCDAHREIRDGDDGFEAAARADFEKAARKHERADFEATMRRRETRYQDATGWHPKHDVYGGPHDETPGDPR